MSTDEFDHSTDIVMETHVIKETITDQTRPLIDDMRQRISTNPHMADPVIAAMYDDATLMRFLRARNLDVKKGTELITEDIEWRSTYRPQDIRANDIEFQATTGKMRVSPLRDRFNRPVVVMHTSFDTKEMKQNPDQQIQYLVWTLEKAVRLLEDPVSKYTVVINLEGFSLFNSPASKVSKESAKCLSSRFPERLGTAVLLNAPFYFRAFYAIVSPFIDVRTKSKIKFVTGDLSEGTEADAKIRGLIGDNWREITGVGQQQVNKTTAPGYNHDEHWAWVRSLEDSWYNSQPATAANPATTEAATMTVEASHDLGKQQPPSYADAVEGSSAITETVSVAAASD